MKRFSSDFIEQVRLANDIVQLINEDTPLKGRGERYMGLCPFPGHTEKTPSFSVSQAKQVYYCFGCRKSGDIFTYLNEQRGLNFMEAIEYLAQQAQISLPKTTAFQDKKSHKRKQAFELNEKVAKFYKENLLNLSPQHAVWKYLNKRNYTKDIIEDFQLGYAPKGTALLKKLAKEDLALAKELGLLNENEKKELYPNYRNRLIFPITSFRHQIEGFGARVLDDSLPKYINSKESPIFHKGRSFYGLDLSARFLREENVALVVEGYTDFISLWQSNIKNVVATLGTALTSDHANVLKRYVNTVILVFDGDQAGVHAAERSLPLLLEKGLEVKGITLPEKQDPDDFIKTQGAEAFLLLIYKSENLFFQILKKQLKEMKYKGETPFHLIERVAPYIQSTQNEALKTLYKQRVLDVFGSDASKIAPLLEKACRSKKTPSSQSLSYQPSSSQTPMEPKPTILEKPSLSKAEPAEQILLALALDSPAFLDNFIATEGLKRIKTSFIFDIFQKLESEYGQNKKKFDMFLPSMMNQVSDNYLLLKESHVALNGSLEEQNQVFEDCLLFLKKNQTRAQANELVAEMRMQNEGDRTQLEKILKLTKERLNTSNKTTSK